MKERGILFGGEMVRAILEGRKTQTRRPMKQEIPPYVTSIRPTESGHFMRYCADIPGAIVTCPYGQPGDHLWVRETFALESNFGLDPCDPPFSDGRPVKWEEFHDDGKFWNQAHYKATDEAPELLCENERCRKCSDDVMGGAHWRPSIHMPRWASRITLEITNVRVERVQDISEEDAKAEGKITKTTESHFGSCKCFKSTHRSEFYNSWSKVYPGSWDRNDWVWVIKFKKI